MYKVVFKCGLSPGDIVMLTAAVRDLHRLFPGRFLTDVRTSCPDLWRHNPYLTPLNDQQSDVTVIECHYPLVREANALPYHFLHGFMQFIGERLGVDLRPTEFKGDIHLAEHEREPPNCIRSLVEAEIPFWVVASGGKFDFTIKWWDIARYQSVVDHYDERILFVQVGDNAHFHPPLKSAVDLRGETSLRELVRIVYHAQGVLSPVSLLMHLAAAVEVPPGKPQWRPCVVVAGGREPAHWEQYPQHQFIHTNGTLSCCAHGGCWRSRTVPIGDGDVNDESHALCLDVVMYKNGVSTRLAGVSHESVASPVEDVRFLPRCMDMITSHEVVKRMAVYFDGGMIQYLSSTQKDAAREAIRARFSENDPTLKAEQRLRSLEVEPLYNSDGKPTAREPISVFQQRFEECASRDYEYPGERFLGKGIVVCGGGEKYFPSVWVVINHLRSLGCLLPIEMWYLGPAEMTPKMRDILTPLGVICVDAETIRKTIPVRRLGGWELKPYAIMNSRFREVIYLDADNVPVRNPDFLFGIKEYLDTGALFWPDIWRLAPHRIIWSICGIAYRNEREFESGQIVIDKSRCWKALNIAMHLNEYSDFYYRHFLGDKETFHLAWMKLSQAYGMPLRDAELKYNTLYQFDFEGELLFQHRNGDKWRLSPPNEAIPGFLFEEECLLALEHLDILLDENSAAIRRWAPLDRSRREREASALLIQSLFMFRRIGCDHRPMAFVRNGKIGRGAAQNELYWDLRVTERGEELLISSKEGATASLVRKEDEVWRGNSLLAGATRVELVPQPRSIGMAPVNPRRITTNRGHRQFEATGAAALPPKVFPKNFQTTIPRVLHVIEWPGCKDDELGKTAESWSSRHRGWKMRLWTKEEIHLLHKDHGPIYAPYHILLSYGGIAVSSPSRCLRNLEPLLAMVAAEAFAGLAGMSSSYLEAIGTSVLGALPGASFLQRVIAEANRMKSMHMGGEQTAEECLSYSVDALTRLAEAARDITVFPRQIFHPSPQEFSLAFACPL